jgi:CrcB protein
VKAPVTEGLRARHTVRAQAPVVAVVALGGGAGAAARYAASQWWPTPAGGFPWTILWVNVVGCFVIGVFMVIISEVRTAHPLVRPFFGTGVLGGFTTFSTYAVDTRTLLAAHHPGTAAAYLGGTLGVGLVAVVAGLRLAERVIR